MADEGMFLAVREQRKPQTAPAPLPPPRLYEPKRDQIEWRAVDIESLIGEDHPARLIWGYVEPLDLSELDDQIKARGETAGHPAIAPRLLLALWLYATSVGVGSARALERLCNSHDAYRWLCGGVECIHARWGNWDLRQVTVRDINKVHNVILWYALTNNILQGHRLLAAQTA
jgi:hypothetical protein